MLLAGKAVEEAEGGAELFDLVTVEVGGGSFARRWHKECVPVPYVPMMERACWRYPVVLGGIVVWPVSSSW